MKNINAEISNDFQTTLPIVENWLSMDRAGNCFGIYEFPMYTDTRLTSELRENCGPYSFINALAAHETPGKIQTGFIFRCEHYEEPTSRHDIINTNEVKYHGGDLKDEVSALASLVLGARVRAGDFSRSFGILNDDAMGTPRANLKAPPSISMRNRELIVPSVFGNRDLRRLKKLNTLLKLNNAQNIALMRAARLYQDALWIVESEPELAWLMLVSALEAGALDWDQQEKTPIEILEAARSDFTDTLREKGMDILDLVAKEVAPLFKTTAKFQKFCLHFLPDAPTTRPPEYMCIEWTIGSWKKILNKIYYYRSRALHSGHPFPRPMCVPSERNNTDMVPCERGTDALAVQQFGAIWNAEDLPISLDIFTQVTRKILIRWWDEIAGESEHSVTY